MVVGNWDQKCPTPEDSANSVSRQLTVECLVTEEASEHLMTQKAACDPLERDQMGGVSRFVQNSYVRARHGGSNPCDPSAGEAEARHSLGI